MATTVAGGNDKMVIISLNLVTKKLQSKGLDPKISSVEFQCANHYTTQPGVIEFILFTELSGFIDSAS